LIRIKYYGVVSTGHAHTALTRTQQSDKQFDCDGDERDTPVQIKPYVFCARLKVHIFGIILQ